jgi:hypothetical protein
MPTCATWESLESLLDRGGDRRFCRLTLYSTGANQDLGNRQECFLLETPKYPCQEH